MPLQPKQQPSYYTPTQFPKIYIAKLSQIDTNDPTSIEIKNTIGEITWSRLSAGVYMTQVISGAFPLNKTIMTIVPQRANNPVAIDFSADQAAIYTGNPVGDEYLDNTSVTIIIYP